MSVVYKPLNPWYFVVAASMVLYNNYMQDEDTVYNLHLDFCKF